MWRFPEPTSGFTHLFSALAAAAALVWLVSAAQHEPAKLAALAVYGASLVALYAASSALHLVSGGERVRRLLLRFDHAAIYLLIAGTYTPFCYHFLSGGWRWGMLAAVWSLALVGVVYKLWFRWNSTASLIFYLLMGWVGVIAAPVALHLLPLGALALLLAGGAVYTLGAVVFALDKPNLHRYFNAHDLWHVFVMGGSALHFIAVALFIV